MLFPKFDRDQMGRKTRLGDGGMSACDAQGKRPDDERDKPVTVSSNDNTRGPMSGPVHFVAALSFCAETNALIEW